MGDTGDRGGPDAERMARLDRLAALERGWDGHGGAPISPLAVATARAMLHPPLIFPMSHGGIQLEWRRGHRCEVVVVVGPDGELEEEGSPVAASVAAASGVGERSPDADGGALDEAERLFARLGAGRNVARPAAPGGLHERHMDEIDAAAAGMRWLEEVRLRRCSGAPSSVQRLDLHRHENGVHIDGGTYLLWGYAGRLVAQCTIVRDDANFAVVTGIEIPDEEDPDGLPPGLRG